MGGMAILQPVVALAAWTMVMWFWLYGTRIPALSAAKVDPDDLVHDTTKGLDQILPPQVQWKAHNYNHLHEAPTVFYAVSIVLAIIGLLHFYFIWFGDILFLYAMTGMVAYLFRKKAARRLLIWSAGFFILNAAMMAASSAYFRTAETEAQAADATEEEITEWKNAGAWGQQSEEKTAKDIAIHRGSAATRAEHMLTERAAEPFGSLIFFGPETLALMLLGMAGYKSGYLTGQWSDRRYRTIALWTLSIGAIASAIIALTTWRSNFDLPTVFFNLVVVQLPFRIAMALGYAALIEWLNPRLVAPHHTARRPTRFLHPEVAARQARGEPHR